MIKDYLKVKTMTPQNLITRCKTCEAEIGGAYILFQNQEAICGACLEDVILKYQQKKADFLACEYVKILREIKVALIGVEMDFRKINYERIAGSIKNAIVNVGIAIKGSE